MLRDVPSQFEYTLAFLHKLRPAFAISVYFVHCLVCFWVDNLATSIKPAYDTTMQIQNRPL